MHHKMSADDCDSDKLEMIAKLYAQKKAELEAARSSKVKTFAIKEGPRKKARSFYLLQL